ncbi:MAG: sulfatase-like hydrolase/transferase, partial [Nitrososphaerota archaeon]|nr:sulfatase-like hydrolase/transferase [Nitrososphaerota archaeon]
SGNVPATVKAVETVDECIGKIVEAWRTLSDYTSLIITSDHGNAEKMYDEKTGQPHTAHTSNLVPFILISKKWKIDAHGGDKLGLKDVAPSILEMLGLAKPEAMTGQSFIHLRPK